MREESKSPGPVAGRAATVRPNARENNKTRKQPWEPAAPGAADDEAQAKEQSKPG